MMPQGLLLIGQSGRSAGESAPSYLHVDVVLNPLTKAAQRVAPILEWLRSSFHASIKVLRAVLCCAVLCCAVLRCAALRCAALCCACAALCRAIPCCAMPHCAKPCCAVLCRNSILCCAAASVVCQATRAQCLHSVSALTDQHAQNRQRWSCSL